MKKFAVSLIFIFLSVLIIDRLGSNLLWQIKQNSQEEIDIKIRYLMHEINSDVLLLGTSCTSKNYVSSILEDSLNMSVYNGGIDGSECIYSHYYILKQVLAHHTPKLICLELWSLDYNMVSDPFKGFNLFAPYFGQNLSADSLFYDSGDWYSYKLSHLYRYNSVLVSTLRNLFNVPIYIKENKGYSPLPKPTCLLGKPNLQEESSKHDPKKLLYLRKFIECCKENKIELVVTIAPIYTLKGKGVYDVLKQIASEYEIPFLDYHSQGLFLNHPEYFYDVVHLCEKGACTFTPVFAHDIKMHLSSMKK